MLFLSTRVKVSEQEIKEQPPTSVFANHIKPMKDSDLRIGRGNHHFARVTWRKLESGNQNITEISNNKKKPENINNGCKARQRTEGKKLQPENQLSSLRMTSSYPVSIFEHTVADDYLSQAKHQLKVSVCQGHSPTT